MLYLFCCSFCTLDCCRIRCEYTDVAVAGVNFNPTMFVDITKTIDLKLEMLNCHESQIVWMRDHDHIDFPDMVKTCSRYRGYQCGAEYAEGFKQCQVYLNGTTEKLLP